jgi:hypothetical protein
VRVERRRGRDPETNDRCEDEEEDRVAQLIDRRGVDLEMPRACVDVPVDLADPDSPEQKPEGCSDRRCQRIREAPANVACTNSALVPWSRRWATMRSANALASSRERWKYARPTSADGRTESDEYNVTAQAEFRLAPKYARNQPTPNRPTAVSARAASQPCTAFTRRPSAASSAVPIRDLCVRPGA